MISKLPMVQMINGVTFVTQRNISVIRVTKRLLGSMMLLLSSDGCGNLVSWENINFSSGYS
jgi:hypothetical protein